MKNEDFSLDFIDELVAQDKANKELMAIADSLTAQGKVAQRLSKEQKLFNDDINEGSLSSLRRAQARAEALIEKLVRFGANTH